MKKAILGQRMFNGKQTIENFCLIFDGSQILYAGPRQDSPLTDNTEIIEKDCPALIPGIIDSHVHIFLDPSRGYAEYAAPPRSQMEFGCIASKNMKNLLEQGIIYIRDMAAYADMSYELRRMMNEGVIHGPGIKICGEGICVTGGHGTWMSTECDGVDEIVKTVRKRIKDGADHIKLMVTGGVSTPGQEKAPCEMEYEEIAAAVREAHKKARKVGVHTHGYTGIKRCVEAGVDSIEHGVYLDHNLLEIMLQKGIYLVPTLSAPHFAVQNALLRDPDNPEHLESAKIMKRHCDAVKMAYDMGVKIAMGTDKGIPGNMYENALSELILLNEVGIPPEEVLKISTYNSADLLDILDRYGSLEPGKSASFILLDADPTTDINNIYAHKSVWQEGQQVFSSR